MRLPRGRPCLSRSRNSGFQRKIGTRIACRTSVRIRDSVIMPGVSRKYPKCRARVREWAGPAWPARPGRARSPVEGQEPRAKPGEDGCGRRRARVAGRGQRFGAGARGLPAFLSARAGIDSRGSASACLPGRKGGTRGNDGGGLVNREAKAGARAGDWSGGRARLWRTYR